MTLGWAQRWKANKWKRNKREKALNVDLWDRLLAQCERHQVEFVWVKGHAGLRENERCDQLSMAALRQKDLPIDVGYEISLIQDQGSFDL
jgi:ribonuclease HI